MSDNANSEDMRLQVFLARSGAASRRNSVEIIQSGRVKVNGKPVLEPGYRVKPEDSVTLDGTNLTLETELLYLAFNKPAEVISSTHDPEGRITVSDIISPSFPQRLFTIGRLDFLSTGLMIVTNDGDFAQLLSHPSSGISRKYQVDLRQPLSKEQLDEWKRGIRVKGIMYHLQAYEILSPRQLLLTLTEGKNREIRNVMAHFRVNIRSLHRVQYGSLSLGNLKPGKFRALSEQEVKNLRLSASAKKTKPRSGGGSKTAVVRSASKSEGTGLRAGKGKTAGDRSSGTSRSKKGWAKPSVKKGQNSPRSRREGR